MATKVWSPTSGNLASTDANWVGGVKPVAGDNIEFDHAVSDGNCTLDEAVTYGNITLGTGYAGTVTLGANIGCADFLMQAGTFTGNISYTITCSGNFTNAGGAFTVNLTILKMIGESKTVTDSSGLRTLQASANINVTGVSVRSYLIVDSGKSINILSAGVLDFSYGASNGITNSGVITGSGIFTIYVLTDFSQAIGTVSCPMVIRGHASMTANRTITMSGNITSSNTFNIYSSHATYTITLATSTFTLTCGALTLGDRGCLSQTGTGGNVTCTSYTQSGASSVLTGKVDATFTCSGNFNQSAGTVTSNVLLLITPNDTTVTTTGGIFRTWTVNGNANITNAVNYRSITIASGKTVTINNGAGLYMNLALGGTVTNNGCVATIGTGLWNIFYNSSTASNQAFGVNTGNARIYAFASPGASRTIGLLADCAFGNVTIDSADATYTCTLDLAGYSLTCSTLTVGVRGILTASLDSTITGNVVLNDATAIMTQTATKSLTITGSLTLTLGTITQLGNLSVGAYSQAGGVFTGTGGTTYWFTCAGNYNKTSGTNPTYKINLRMTGTDITFSENESYCYHSSLSVIGSVTIVTSLVVSTIFALDGNINISSGKELWAYSTASSSAGGIVTGTIGGSGKLFLGGVDSKNLKNLSVVTINCPVEIGCINGGGASSTHTATSNIVINNTLTVKSRDAVRTGTLDLAGYSLTCTSLTVSTRGILLGGEGAITVNGGAFDSSAGTFTEETSTVIMNGASTIKLAAGQKFYNLLVTNTRTLSSDISVTNYFVHARDLVLGAYSLTMTDALKNLGSWVLHPVCNAVRTPNISSAENYILRYVAK